MTEMSFDTFKLMSRRQLNLDFEGYRESQLQRRLSSFMQKRGFQDYLALLKYLQNNSQEISGFRDYLAINVSEFYRNPEMFQYVADNVLPALGQNGTVRMWSAGCSVGCEAYTLAILAEEQHFPGNWSVLATDIDNQALNSARAGIYDQELIKLLPESYQKKYFMPRADHYEVNHHLKRKITFQIRDLLKDSYPTGLDLIACRNVVIYFTEEAKTEVFARMSSSLRSGGILFIGATEGFHNYQNYKLKRLHPCIYQRI